MSSKNILQIEGETEPFPLKQKWRELIMPRPTLEEILKVVFKVKVKEQWVVVERNSNFW